MKTILKSEKEYKRLYDFWEDERVIREDFNIVVGVDEVGRGPLAGPVYAACVFLPTGISIPGLKDSKKLSEEKREEIGEQIKEVAYAYTYGYASVEEIDAVNILNATHLAMKRAISKMPLPIDLCLIDGNSGPKLSVESQLMIKGDDRYPSIAAASILAKVKRDHIMTILDEVVPEYGFSKHKGYGTKVHYEAIEKYGITPYHRKTFLKGLNK